MQTIAAEIPHDLNPTSNYTNANVHRIKSFLKKVTNWISKLASQILQINI